MSKLENYKEYTFEESDFENNPHLYDAGYSVGDTIEVADYSNIESVKIEIDGNVLDVKECMTVILDGEEKHIIHRDVLLNSIQSWDE